MIAPHSARPIEEQERGYFREREAEERDAAAAASCMVKDVHLELADLYAELARPATEGSPVSTDGPVDGSDGAIEQMPR